jgi:hypothetical protein
MISPFRDLAFKGSGVANECWEACGLLRGRRHAGRDPRGVRSACEGPRRVPRRPRQPAPQGPRLTAAVTATSSARARASWNAIIASTHGRIDEPGIRLSSRRPRLLLGADHRPKLAYAPRSARAVADRGELPGPPANLFSAASHVPRERYEALAGWADRRR